MANSRTATKARQCRGQDHDDADRVEQLDEQRQQAARDIRAKREARRFVGGINEAASLPSGQHRAGKVKTTASKHKRQAPSPLPCHAVKKRARLSAPVADTGNAGKQEVSHQVEQADGEHQRPEPFFIPPARLSQDDQRSDHQNKQRDASPAFPADWGEQSPNFLGPNQRLFIVALQFSSILAGHPQRFLENDWGLPMFLYLQWPRHLDSDVAMSRIANARDGK